MWTSLRYSLPPVLLTTLILLTGVNFADAGCTQISASVRLLMDTDLKYNCYIGLQNLKSLNARSVNFVITQYWIDEGADMVPDYFCNKLGRHPCVAVTDKYMQEFSTSLAHCISAANDMGFTTIELTPHLDDGNVTGRWRNLLQLNPEANYGGWSYKDFHITPILNAIKQANNKAALYMSVQGEMNTAIIMYPWNWKNIADYIRGEIPGIKVGINNNFNDLCPNCPVQPDVGALRTLYFSVDYIGISAYAKVPQGVGPDDIAQSALQFQLNMAPFGIDLYQVLAQPGKELHYSEFGVGGAAICGGQFGLVAPDCVATSGTQVAGFPFFGIGSSFRGDQNPWQNGDAYNFMKTFYYMATQFAAAGGAAGFQVTQIYVWGYGSYDVLGVHPMSTTGYGSWKQWEVAGMIANHNQYC